MHAGGVEFVRTSANSLARGTDSFRFRELVWLGAWRCARIRRRRYGIWLARGRRPACQDTVREGGAEARSNDAQMNLGSRWKAGGSGSALRGIAPRQGFPRTGWGAVRATPRPVLGRRFYERRWFAAHFCHASRQPAGSIGRSEKRASRELERDLRETVCDEVRVAGSRKRTPRPSTAPRGLTDARCEAYGRARRRCSPASPGARLAAAVHPGLCS